MSQQHHLWEKIVVEVAAVAALAASYFLAAPSIDMSDPEMPLAFLPSGQWGQAVRVALMIWGLTIACTLLTVSARPEGSLLAALAGSCGFSLYSPRLRGLLWYRQDDLPGLFRQLAAEVAVLAIVLAGAAILVTLIRRMVGAVRPNWGWRSPLLRTDAPSGGWLDTLFGPGYYQTSGEEDEQPPSPRQRALKGALFLLAAAMVSMVLLFLLMQSSDRGQILFALLASFTLGVLIAHQALPVPSSLLCWVAPVPVAVLFYLLASVAAGSQGHDWVNVRHYALALPIDWITVGSAGGILGFWISERIHEMRHFEQQAMQDGEAEDAKA